MKRTTIIATLGPASSDRKTIEKLVRAGANVFRLNFSHGSYEDHSRLIDSIRNISLRTGSHIAILQDLQGPKIRIGDMPPGGVELKKNHSVRLVTRHVTGSAEVIPTQYAHLPRDVEKGDRILIDDGYLELKVLGSGRGYVDCRVARGGTLVSHKGMNLPGVDVSAPSLTKKDIADLEFGISRGVDYVAMSFVRSANDMKKLRRHVRRLGAGLPLIAKIERPEAIDALVDIIKESDGVMVARGDLGVEMPPERVPQLQKRIIEETNTRGKTAITATQMLESMISNSRPTRAEASDVANAVYDQSGAVMLSGETAVGRHPVEAVKFAARICSDAEQRLYETAPMEPSEFLKKAAGFSGAVAYSAVRAARELDARAIMAFTQSGTTAHLVSKYRPCCDIIGATMSDAVARKMSMFWGVTPLVLDRISSMESLVKDVDEALLKRRLAKKGDTIVITSGVPIGTSGTTNLMKIHRVGRPD